MYLTGGMPNPYDVALRERVVAAYDAGTGTALEVAHLFGLGHRTVQRWVTRWRTTGSVAPLSETLSLPATRVVARR